jgi:hypothetical protein
MNHSVINNSFLKTKNSGRQKNADRQLKQTHYDNFIIFVLLS